MCTRRINCECKKIILTALVGILFDFVIQHLSKLKFTILSAQFTFHFNDHVLIDN